MAAGTFAVCLLMIGLASAYNLDMCRVKHPVMQNFDFSKIDGWWYEYARYPNIIQYLEKQRCNVHHLTQKEDRMELMYYFDNDANGTQVLMEGNVTQNADKPGQIFINLPEAGLYDYFSVLDAKYDDYIVIYSCNTLWYFKIELAWVLTRKELTEDKKESLMQRLKALKIDTKRLEFVNHEKC